MNSYGGPTPADLKRMADWKAWRSSIFERIAEETGQPNSSGATRAFGDFDFTVEALADRIACVWVATRGHMPLLHRTLGVRWERVTAAEAAAAILAEYRELMSHPFYVWSKRARSLEEAG